MRNEAQSNSTQILKLLPLKELNFNEEPLVLRIAEYSKFFIKI
jgi:hypothetical protein